MYFTTGTLAVVFGILTSSATASTATSALLAQPTDLASQARIFGFADPDGDATVCSLHCDQRSASDASEDLNPVDDFTLDGRTVRLHVSDADVMAWAGIKDGQVGDELWLERSWDAGETEGEKVGNFTLVEGQKNVSSPMFNMADTTAHRRAILRACLSTDGVETSCTNWAYQKACEVEGVCDGEEISAPTGGYFPVPVTSLDGRTLELHMDDRGIAWATIRAAQPDDEVWIDRSWDPDVAKQITALGYTTVLADGKGRADTQGFVSRDVRLLMYGGAVRACGQTDKIKTCTNWARPTQNRAAAAIDALMYDFQTFTAWWLSSWWNSAVSVHTVIDFIARSPSSAKALTSEYAWVIERAYTQNKPAFAAGIKSTDELLGDFLSRAIDDALWWGLAWADAHALTANATYLDAAKIIADYGAEYWDEGTCDGGIWWDAEKTYKNAVTIGQYIKLSAQLHTQSTDEADKKLYRERALKAWQWYIHSGIIDPDTFLINDGLTEDCANNGGTVWSYNQGLGIGAAVEIYRITSASYSNSSISSEALSIAQSLADAALSSSELTQDGILTENCDVGATCDDNQKQFKGIFMRYMADLAKTLQNEASDEAQKYVDFVNKQAKEIWETQTRDTLNRLGQRWGGGETNVHDWRTQASAAGGLIAALSLET